MKSFSIFSISNWIKLQIVKPDNQKATLMMRYLLGELSEDELLQFEAEYFADPTLFQEIRAARDDLIDAYLRDELAPHERERFENFFMASPHRRERVEVARALITVVNGARQPPTTHARPLAITSWLKSLLSALTLRRWAFVAAVALLILLAGLWLVIKRGPTRQPLEVKQAPPLGQEPSPSNRKPEEAAASSPTPEAQRPEVAAPPPVTPTASRLTSAEQEVRAQRDLSRPAGQRRLAYQPGAQHRQLALR